MTQAIISSSNVYCTSYSWSAKRNRYCPKLTYKYTIEGRDYAGYNRVFDFTCWPDAYDFAARHQRAALSRLPTIRLMRRSASFLPPCATPVTHGKISSQAQSSPHSWLQIWSELGRDGLSLKRLSLAQSALRKTLDFGGRNGSSGRSANGRRELATSDLDSSVGQVGLSNFPPQAVQYFPNRVR